MVDHSPPLATISSSQVTLKPASLSWSCLETETHLQKKLMVTPHKPWAFIVYRMKPILLL